MGRRQGPCGFCFFEVAIHEPRAGLAAPDTGALEDQDPFEMEVAAWAKTGSRKLFGGH